MTPRPILTGFVTVVASCMILLAALVAPAQDGGGGPYAPDGIAVANLVYAEGRSGVCFADQFLTTYARETGQQVERTFVSVQLGEDALFDHPFVVLSGEKTFTLSQGEKDNLKAYIDRGGFVLASAGCSNRAWAESFLAVMHELYGEDVLTPLDTTHPILNTLYDIDTIEVRRATGGSALYGLEVDGRVRVVFTPIGLNDTANAGGGCCCCGGSEIRNARLINANILAYALTH
ncbi:MAG: DUF4159 domain-containing protein [Planctomycetota bacterium]